MYLVSCYVSVTLVPNLQKVACLVGLLYFSDTGTKPPESCVFSQLLCFRDTGTKPPESCVFSQFVMFL